MNGIVFSVHGDLSSVLNALNMTLAPEKAERMSDLLRNEERRKTLKEKATADVRKRTALAMLGAIGRDVRDARSAFEGDHTPEAKERLGHMFDVVDQLENFMAED